MTSAGSPVSLVRGALSLAHSLGERIPVRILQPRRDEKIRAVIPSIMTAAFGYILMAFPTLVYWAVLVYEFGFLLLMLGLISLPLVIFFGPLDG